jgi:HK97 gp10 family phage protein
VANSVRVNMRVGEAALQQLRAKLDAIGKNAGTKAIRGGINELTKTVLAEAKANVPVRTGQLRKSLGRKVKTYRESKIVVGIVGPRKGFRVIINGAAVNPSNYAHLVEFGRGPVKAGQKKNRRGKVSDTGQSVLSSKYSAVAPAEPQVFGPEVGPAAPRPFLRPAWDRVRPTASAVLRRHLEKALKDLLAKNAMKRAA